MSVEEQFTNISLIGSQGTESTGVPKIQWVRWVDILVGCVGLFIGLYSLFINTIILAVLVRMNRRWVRLINTDKVTN